MKKTISINISGVIFNIEEDAYEKLKKYLDTISGYFTDSDGKDEIMADIEARIAELFQARLHEGKNVIGMQDVDEVMDVMGRPEEYLDEESASVNAGRDRSRQGKRRIYRDVDKNVFGGVCAGISHYFGWDPIWMRLIWALSVILFGFGFILYIILWIIIPAARTTAEKLEMMGEPITVENIKKKVTETFEGLKTKADGQGLDTDFQVGYAKEQVGRGGDFLVDILKRFFNFIGRVLGFIFLLAGLAIILFLSYAYLDGSLLQVDGQQWEWGLKELQTGLFTSNLHSYMFITGLILFVMVPLIALVLLGIRLLFRVQFSGKGVVPVMFTLWLIGLVTLAISGIGLGKEFANDEGVSEYHRVQLTGDTLYLDVNDDIVFSNAVRWRHGRFPNELMELRDDSVFCGFPELEIKQQLGKTYVELEVEKESHGYTSEAAFDRADRVHYGFVQRGDTLYFDPYFSFALEDKLRSQTCDMTLRIPEGQVIYIGSRLPRILEYARNKHDVDIEDMTDKSWIMTDEGLRSGTDTEEDDPDAEDEAESYTAQLPAQLKFVPSTPLFALDVKHGDTESRK
ncbi:MAG: PspC domain-containing protein [Flavobacteriales bacterium]|nr:PspC domain-containing protein [Flavobacteriales bacterium]